MDKFRVLGIKQSFIENNDHQANLLLNEIKIKKTFLFNLVSPPDFGKTTNLTQTIKALMNQIRQNKNVRGFNWQ